MPLPAGAGWQPAASPSSERPLRLKLQARPAALQRSRTLCPATLRSVRLALHPAACSGAACGERGEL